MTHYRIYELNNVGRITRGSDGWFDADSAACAFAFTGLERGDRREVWRDTKCVGFYIGSCINVRPVSLPKVRDACAALLAGGSLSRPSGAGPPGDTLWAFHPIMDPKPNIIRHKNFARPV